MAKKIVKVLKDMPISGDGEYVKKGAIGQLDSFGNFIFELKDLVNHKVRSNVFGATHFVPYQKHFRIE